jgi:hypothetical protein
MKVKLNFQLADKFLKYNNKTGLLFWKIKRGQKGVPGREAGTISDGYKIVTLFGIRYQASRVIWLLRTKNFPKGKIDHIDRNRSNNKFENLRDTTIAINNKNKSLSKNNTSGINGVYWRKDRGMWSAMIRSEGRLIYLGLFSSIKKAAEARKNSNRRFNFHPSHGQ